MYGNTIGAETLAVLRYFQYIRHITTTRIAESGKFVDVYA
jgi:hypothetical protein